MNTNSKNILNLDLKTDCYRTFGLTYNLLKIDDSQDRGKVRLRRVQENRFFVKKLRYGFISGFISNKLT